MDIRTLVEIVCVLLVAALGFALIAVAFAEPDYDFEEVTYIVETGDCLWYIANEYCPESMDKQEYCDLIAKRNSLRGGLIYPGQYLIVYRLKA